MDSILIFFADLIEGFSHPKLFLLLLCDSMNRNLHRFWFCGCPASYMYMYVLVGCMKLILFLWNRAGSPLC